MAAKNLERALYGPSTMEVALGAVLGLALGVLTGVVFLVFKPIQTVPEIPKKAVRGVIYFVPGHDSNAKSRGWQAKRKQFIAGGNIQVVEDELNEWASDIGADLPPPPPKPAPKAPPKPPAPGAKPEPAKPATDGIFNPGKPNFRIADGKIQIGLTCTLNWYGLTQDVNVKATGTIVRDGDQYTFAPEEFYFGSCPMHLIPVAARPLAAHLLAREHVPDAIRTAWARLKEVTIDGATLKLAAQ